MTNFIKFPKLSYKNRTKKSNQLQGRHFNRWQKVSERHRWHCWNVIATKFKLVVYWVGNSFLKCWFLRWIWWQSKVCVRKSWSCPLQCAMRDLTATAKAKGCKQVRMGSFAAGLWWNGIAVNFWQIVLLDLHECFEITCDNQPIEANIGRNPNHAIR